MRALDRRSSHALRLGFSAACAAALLASTGGSASADRGPSFPSVDDVSRAAASEQSAADQAVKIDADLAAARAGAAAAATSAAAADMAATSAELLVRERSGESATATALSQVANAAAADAQLSLSLYAAQVYQQGSSSLGQLGVLLGDGGPQASMDRASGVDAVGDELVSLVAQAESAGHLAESTRKAAFEATARQQEAADEAHTLQEQSAAAVSAATAARVSLEVQSRALVDQLAALRQTSTGLEQQRQAGLAAAADAARVEAARQAGIAAAQEAARQAEAQAAAQQVAAAAQEQAARSRQEEAAAAAAKAAAAAAAVAARNAAPKPAPPTSPSSGVPLNLANAAMWDRIAWCESGQNWHINTGSGYYGGLQFNMQAWLGFGGGDFAPRADLASREEQITIANRLYAQLGLRPWTCRTAA